jgi:anti-sigma regulatory factor (Ser/Thr protein kinase)
MRAARHAAPADTDGGAGDLAAGRLVDGVAAALVGSGWPAGDVTFLAARRRSAPPVMHARFPAAAATPALAREAVRSWLAPLGARPAEVDVLLYAVAELVANAGEHAYPRGRAEAGEVTVTASLRHDSTVRLSVADRGRWAPPRHDARDRGLGLALTRGLVDAFEVDAADTGTTVTVRASVSRPATLEEATATPPPGDGTIGDVWHHWTGTGMSVGARGPLDDPTVPELHAHIVAATAPGLPPATLDLRRVTLLTSAVVRLIMRSRQSNHDLEILAPAGTVAERVLSLAAIPHTTTSGREAGHG